MGLASGSSPSRIGQVRQVHRHAAKRRDGGVGGGVPVDVDGRHAALVHRGPDLRLDLVVLGEVEADGMPVFSVNGIGDARLQRVAPCAAPGAHDELRRLCPARAAIDGEGEGADERGRVPLRAVRRVRSWRSPWIGGELVVANGKAASRGGEAERDGAPSQIERSRPGRGRTRTPSAPSVRQRTVTAINHAVALEDRCAMVPGRCSRDPPRRRWHPVRGGES